MPICLIILLSITAMGSGFCADSGNPACIPQMRTDWSEGVTGMWIQRAQKQQATEGVAQVLFLGDSITQLWLSDDRWPNGQVTWDRCFKPLKSLNFGIAADRTENLLWRIANGKMIDGLGPKVTVLLIGTNNLHRPEKQDSPQQVSEGVELVVKTIREKLPNTKILLLGILPREFIADAPQRIRVKQVNERLAKLSDSKHVYYLDIGDKFLNPDGTADKEILRDGLHLSAKGYEIFASNLLPEVKSLSEK